MEKERECMGEKELPPLSPLISLIHSQYIYSPLPARWPAIWQCTYVPLSQSSSHIYCLCFRVLSSTCKETATLFILAIQQITQPPDLIKPPKWRRRHNFLQVLSEFGQILCFLSSRGSQMILARTLLYLFGLQGASAPLNSSMPPRWFESQPLTSKHVFGDIAPYLYSYIWESNRTF